GDGDHVEQPKPSMQFRPLKAQSRAELRQAGEQRDDTAPDVRQEEQRIVAECVRPKRRAGARFRRRWDASGSAQCLLRQKEVPRRRRRNENREHPHGHSRDPHEQSYFCRTMEQRERTSITPRQLFAVGYSRSRIIATPIPPAAHTVRSPYCSPVRCSSLQTVVMMRAPVAPNGWPRAIEPPVRLIFSGSISPTGSLRPNFSSAIFFEPIHWMFDSTCAANAS